MMRAPTKKKLGVFRKLLVKKKRQSEAISHLERSVQHCKDIYIINHINYYDICFSHSICMVSLCFALKIQVGYSWFADRVNTPQHWWARNWKLSFPTNGTRHVQSFRPGVLQCNAVTQTDLCSNRDSISCLHFTLQIWFSKNNGLQWSTINLK